MRLSKLQKFILVQCWNSNKKEVPRRGFLRYYPSTRSARSGPPLRSGALNKKIPSMKDQHNIITKSLIRLIKRDLLTGFGKITQDRIFVERVKITRTGRREARRLLDRQQKLPLKIKKQ